MHKRPRTSRRGDDTRHQQARFARVGPAAGAHVVQLVRLHDVANVPPVCQQIGGVVREHSELRESAAQLQAPAIGKLLETVDPLNLQDSRPPQLAQDDVQEPREWISLPDAAQQKQAPAELAVDEESHASSLVQELNHPDERRAEPHSGHDAIEEGSVLHNVEGFLGIEENESTLSVLRIQLRHDFDGGGDRLGALKNGALRDVGSLSWAAHGTND